MTGAAETAEQAREPGPEDDARVIDYLHGRLRPHAGALSDQELRRQATDGLAAARVLAISKPRDVYRFLRLQYLPPAALARPGAHDVFVRVLTDTSVEAGERLRFVERLAQEPERHDAP